jgi:hypothetical protein
LKGKIVPANDHQVGGSHYRGKFHCPNCKHEIQHWDRAWAMNFDVFQYIITKWIERWRDKGGVEDLRKTQHAIAKYIELAELEEEQACGPQARGYADQG